MYAARVIRGWWAIVLHLVRSSRVFPHIFDVFLAWRNNTKLEKSMELHHKMDTRLGWDEQNPKLSFKDKTSKEVAFKDAYDCLRADAVLKLLENLDVFLPNINKNLEVFEEALGDYLHC